MIPGGLRIQSFFQQEDDHVVYAASPGDPIPKDNLKVGVSFVASEYNHHSNPGGLHIRVLEDFLAILG
jgi:hypothetical protein